jgi:LEA14-like dessication related protein
MKLYTSTLWVLFFGIAIFMTSCRTPRDLEFREFKNLSLEKIGFTGANLNAEIVFYNPNNFGLELNRTDLDIYLDSSYLGHSSQDIQVAIPKRDIFSIPLKVDLDLKNLLKNGLSTLFRKEVMIRVVGKVKVGKAGVLKSFNIDYQTIQNIDLF